MAVFTNVTKNRLSWVAPETSDTGVIAEAYEFLISDDFKLDIGGFHLTIQPEKTEIQWTHSGKKKLSFITPTTETETFLNIGDGFNLNIGNGFVLKIGTGERNVTPWTSITKKKLAF